MKGKKNNILKLSLHFSPHQTFLKYNLLGQIQSLLSFCSKYKFEHDY